MRELISKTFQDFLNTPANLAAIIPPLLACMFALDFASRFFSVERLAYNPAEVLQRYRLPFSPLQPNASCFKRNNYGDLTNAANRPNLRHYRPMLMSSDELGYRNPPHTAQRKIDVLILGSSLTIGNSVNDDQTLSSQLEKLTGVTCYNAGFRFNDGGCLYPIFQPDIQRMFSFIDALQMHSGTVFFEFSERCPSMPPGGRELVDTPENNCRLAFIKLVDKLHITAPISYVQGFLIVSPLQQVCIKLHKWLINRFQLPNPYLELAAIRQLKNGKTILFFPAEVQYFSEYRDPALSMPFFIELAKGLGLRGLKFAVVLVPCKYRVYHDLLQPSDRGYEDYPCFFTRLARALSEKKIPVVDLTDMLRAAAEDEIKKDSYVYWLDDTHWNPHGINLSARALANLIQDQAKHRTAIAHPPRTQHSEMSEIKR
jgi:hypothetical protein